MAIRHSDFVILSSFVIRHSPLSSKMKHFAQTLSALALVGTLLPACLFFADRLSLPAAQNWMLGAVFLWFLATPLWMEHKAS